MSSANADDLQFLPPAPPHPAQGLRPVGGKSLFLGFPSCSAMEAGEGADLRAMALLGWGGGFPPGGGGGGRGPRAHLLSRMGRRQIWYRRM